MGNLERAIEIEKVNIATEAKKKADNKKVIDKAEKEKSTAIRVSNESAEITIIDARDFDAKKHLHVSGRPFTADEVKGFKGK